MLLEIISKLLKRDLEKLRKEISLYRDESRIWYVEKSIANSAGNLCLHLVGNLNKYIGAIYGNSGYIRERDLEFSLKNLSREELIKKIADTSAIVESTLANMNESQLTEEYPELVFQEKSSTEYMFIHLISHLGYHLGQVNYHRRLLDTFDI